MAIEMWIEKEGYYGSPTLSTHHLDGREVYHNPNETQWWGGNGSGGTSGFCAKIPCLFDSRDPTIRVERKGDLVAFVTWLNGSAHGNARFVRCDTADELVFIVRANFFKGRDCTAFQLNGKSREAIERSGHAAEMDAVQQKWDEWEAVRRPAIEGLVEAVLAGELSAVEPITYSWRHAKTESLPWCYEIASQLEFVCGDSLRATFPV